MSQPMAEPETPVVFLHQVERRFPYRLVPPKLSGGEFLYLFHTLPIVRFYLILKEDTRGACHHRGVTYGGQIMYTSLIVTLILIIESVSASNPNSYPPRPYPFIRSMRSYNLNDLVYDFSFPLIPYLRRESIITVIPRPVTPPVIPANQVSVWEFINEGIPQEVKNVNKRKRGE